MRKVTILCSALLATAFTVVACSSTTTTTSGGGGGSGTDSGSGSGTDSGSGGGGDSGGGGGDMDSGASGGDSMCGAAASLATCETCCTTNHATGAKTFTDSITACACKGTGAATDAGLDAGAGPCATACGATVCAAMPKNPDSACNTCLQASVNQGGACFDKVGTDCNADADCTAEQACLLMQCKGKM